MLSIISPEILHRLQPVYERTLAKPVRQLFFMDVIRQTGEFKTLAWNGVPIWRRSYDDWTTTETIQAVQPMLIIETGTHVGGSALYFANLLDLIGQGRVISMDVEDRHQRDHPRIEFLIGDSTSEERVLEVRTAAEDCGGAVLVILDSDHRAEHVLREMEAYGPAVTPGSYMLVQDGLIDVVATMRQPYPGPLHGIKQFLSRHPEFEVDEQRCNQFLITYHPMGWLHRLQ
jgi:cephalosporin hydroxylase